MQHQDGMHAHNAQHQQSCEAFLRLTPVLLPVGCCQETCQHTGYLSAHIMFISILYCPRISISISRSRVELPSPSSPRIRRTASHFIDTSHARLTSKKIAVVHSRLCTHLISSSIQAPIFESEAEWKSKSPLPSNSIRCTMPRDAVSASTPSAIRLHGRSLPRF
jgi:hypothetical protein